MIRSTALVLATALASAPAPHAGAVDTPRQLVTACESLVAGAEGTGTTIEIPNTREALLCWGYMQAMQDLSVLVVEGGGRLIAACPPEDTTLLQIIRSFLRYARAHPDALRGNASVVVIAALQDAFPCRNGRDE